MSEANIARTFRPTRAPFVRRLNATSDTSPSPGPTLVLVEPAPWYATTPPSPEERRRELEDEHSRLLAQAVGDHLPHELAQGLAPSSVAQRVSAVRRLAAAIGADALVQQVRCTEVQHERPRALSDLELSQLLASPDRRTTSRAFERLCVMFVTGASKHT